MSMGTLSRRYSNSCREHRVAEGRFASSFTLGDASLGFSAHTRTNFKRARDKEGRTFLGFAICVLVLRNSYGSVLQPGCGEQVPTLLPGRWLVKVARQSLPLHVDYRLLLLEMVVDHSRPNLTQPVFIMKLLNVRNCKMRTDLRKKTASKKKGISQAFSEIIAGAADTAFSIFITKASPKGALLHLKEPSFHVETTVLTEAEPDVCLGNVPCVYGVLMQYLGKNLLSTDMIRSHHYLRMRLRMDSHNRTAQFYQSLSRLSLLDALMSNFDRSASNCFWDSQGLYGLDNGAGLYKYFAAIKLIEHPQVLSSCAIPIFGSNSVLLNHCKRLETTKRIIHESHKVNAREQLLTLLSADPVMKLLSNRYGPASGVSSCLEGQVGPTYAKFFLGRPWMNVSRYVVLEGQLCLVDIIAMVVDFLVYRWSELEEGIEKLLSKGKCNETG